MPQARDEAGNIWEVDAQGNPVALVSQAGTPQGPPASPAFQYEGQKAQADVANVQSTIADRTADNRRADATLPYDIQKASADAAKAQAEADKLGRAGTKSETERAAAIMGYQSAEALDQIISDLEQKYKDGPGSTSGVFGAQDYLPTEANQRFDNAANAARGTVGQALGFTGGQLNSAAEAQMNIGPFIPSSSDKDGAIEDAIQRLKDLREQAKSRSVAILGGVPDVNGNITPVQQQADPRESGITPFNRAQITGGEAPKAAGSGATTVSEPVPEAMQQEHQAFMAQWMQQPNPSTADYLEFRKGLDEKYGGSSDPAANKQYVDGVLGALRTGQGGIPINIPPRERELSSFEKFRNDVASSKAGAGVIGLTDAVGMGAVTALAPEQMNAAREENPNSMMAGEVLGAIGATGAIGAIGRNTIGRAAPKLLGGGGKSKFARNLAADATYGGVYGGVTEGDPLTGATLASIGSAGGQGVAKGLGAATGGIKLDKAVQTLRDRNIPLTTGQTLGGFANAVEDKATSLPLVGDLIKARRMDGVDAFNRAAFDEATALSGRQTDSVSEAGIRQIQDEIIPQQYDRALSGQRFQADEQFGDDIAGRLATAEKLPTKVAEDTNFALKEGISPYVGEAGDFDGRGIQRIFQEMQTRGSKLARSQEVSGGDGANVLRGAVDDLGELVNRQAPEVMPAFRDANTTFGNSQILQDAVAKGLNNGGKFTPAQLGMATRANAKKFGGKHARPERPFYDLQRSAQDVLPSSIPDSGTAGRGLQMAVGATALGGAGASDAYAGTDILNPTSGTMAALLMLGGTKKGQKLINTALTERPKLLQDAALQIRKRKGLFGSASIPIAMQFQGQ